MFIAKSNLTTFFDVDDTLIYWTEPSLKEGSKEVIFEFNGFTIKKYVIIPHVEELKLQKESGSYIVVWSASGYQWAEAIVKALELEEYVDLIISKPTRYYDDKEASKWLPNRRYLI